MELSVLVEFSPQPYEPTTIFHPQATVHPIRLVFPDPPRLFGYRQKNHEKINSSRKNRLKKSMTRRYPKRRGGSGNTSLTHYELVSTYISLTVILDLDW